MSKNDSYAIKEASRRKLYEEAYESAEAKAWLQSLSPAERERAEALGLLQALPDTDVSSRSLDTIPPQDAAPGNHGNRKRRTVGSSTAPQQAQ